MATRPLCATGEWYHCFNRGIDKRTVFIDEIDHMRFVTLLYTSNGTNPIRISDRYHLDLSTFLERDVDRGEALIEIGAYSLMPNHMHIVVKQLRDKGIARFMQKVFTGYTMYFNLKNSRTGALFSGTYKARHIDDDSYLKRVIPYVLLNPAELFEPQWKDGVADLQTLEEEMRNYRFSSLPDFIGEKRPENKIVSPLNEYYDHLPMISYLLEEARAYHQDYPSEIF